MATLMSISACVLQKELILILLEVHIHVHGYVVVEFWFWFNLDFAVFFSMLIYDNKYQTMENPN